MNTNKIATELCKIYSISTIGIDFLYMQEEIYYLTQKEKRTEEFEKLFDQASSLRAEILLSFYVFNKVDYFQQTMFAKNKLIEKQNNFNEHFSYTLNLYEKVIKELFQYFKKDELT